MDVLKLLPEEIFCFDLLRHVGILPNRKLSIGFKQTHQRWFVGEKFAFRSFVVNALESRRNPLTFSYSTIKWT